MALPVFTRVLEKTGLQRLNQEYGAIAAEMKKSYDNGDLNDVIDLFTKHCLQQGKEKEEKQEFHQVKKEIRADIYRWLMLSYMTLDMPEAGNFYLRKMLALRPHESMGDYWLSIRDAAENKYYTAPRLLLGLKIGPNITTARAVKSFSIINPAFASGDFDGFSYQKDYGGGLVHSWGTQWGCVIEYTLAKNLSIGFQPDLRYLKFQYVNRYKWQEVEINGINYGTTTTAKVTHGQFLYYLELPVFLKYRFLTPKFQPYVQVGGFYRILESASKSVRAVVHPEVEAFRDIAGEDVRKHFAWGNGGFLVGAGIGLDTRKARLEVEINYKHVFNNIIAGDCRFDNPELMYAFYDVFDDIKVSNWDISMKILLPLSFKAFRR
jgi:hypothetical protein